MLNFKDYENKLAFPAFPKKPELPKNPTSKQLKEAAVLMEEYESMLKKAKEERAAYNTETERLEIKFKFDLFDEYGVKNQDKGDKIFQKAWDDSHANGYVSVVAKFDELMEFVDSLGVEL